MPEINGSDPNSTHASDSAGKGAANGATNGATNGSHSNSLHGSYPIDPFGPHTSIPGGPQSKAHAKVESYTDDSYPRFPRISRPVQLLRTSYDCVVIGSGYGGGVAASRMARAGQSVCLLERGKERWPGEFPSTLIEAMEQLHVSGLWAPHSFKGRMIEGGDPTGLYHLIVGQGQNAFVGNGLGGTSLLNANVFLRTDDGTMGLKYWPPELRIPGALEEYYDLAEYMLEPTTYPENWPRLPKLEMLKRQADALGMSDKFRRVTQTTRFLSGPNSTGVEMNPSANTGQDSTGVNDGSKSSTLVNYLSDAWNWGAEMFCECEVRYIEKHPEEEGYLVYFAWHGGGRGKFKENIYEDLMWVHAKKCVFLGAGALGTSEILLRSKENGLSMSNRVGRDMSGNGDILAFGYNCDDNVNAIGREFPSPYHPIGPTINGIIDCREGHDNPLDGFVIEEGAVPKALAPLFQTMLELMPDREAPKNLSLLEKVQHVLARTGSHLLGPYYQKGSIEKTMIYLIMSHDSNQAILSLENDKPVLRFLGVGRSEHVQYLNSLLAKATDAVGGTFINSPFYAALGEQEITVHPIGGACMSNDGTGAGGVTNHFGEVFRGEGSDTYDGLVVTDASVIPTALGVNPFATITALAERSVKHVADKMDITIDLETKNGTLDLFGRPKHTVQALSDDDSVIKAEALIEKTQAAKSAGIEFSEIMSGFIHFRDDLKSERVEDFENNARIARGRGEMAKFFLSVRAWDTQTVVKRSDHLAMLTGTVTCAGLPGSPFMVNRGDFQLFNTQHDRSGTQNLTYNFNMTGNNGDRYHFHGYKIVDASATFNPLVLWKATTTLYVTIKSLSGPVNSPTVGPIVGQGILHIGVKDFLSEAMTLTPVGHTILDRVTSAYSFVSYFARQAARHLLVPLIPLQYPMNSIQGFNNPTPVSQTIKVTASDGVQSYVQMWEARPYDPNLEVHDLLMVPGASVDHNIYALPTIRLNAVQYFTRAGYRVWTVTHRIGKTMDNERNPTVFDARLDIQATLAYIRKTHGETPRTVYVIAHCMGSVALASGTLDGTIPGKWIKGITASQVFMNPKWGKLNMAKVHSPVPLDWLYKKVAGNWFSCTSSKEDSFVQQGINQILRAYPDEYKELCNNVSCHRVSFVFGRCWNHSNINEATHTQLDRFFGGMNMTNLHVLMSIGRLGYVHTNYPLAINLVTPTNLRRLRNIPMFLFSGSDNVVLTPESTDISYSILRDTFGAENYERVEIQGYGHLDPWMGVNAARDVYPVVRERVDKVCRGKDYVYKGDV